AQSGEYREDQAQRDRCRERRLHDADRRGYNDPGRPYRRADRLGDRRPRPRSAREGGTRRVGTGCRGDGVALAVASGIGSGAQPGGGEDEEESEEGEVEEQEGEKGKKSRPEAQAEARRGEAVGQEGSSQRPEESARPETRPRSGAGTFLHSALLVAVR